MLCRFNPFFLFIRPYNTVPFLRLLLPLQLLSHSIAPFKRHNSIWTSVTVRFRIFYCLFKGDDIMERKKVKWYRMTMNVTIIVLFLIVIVVFSIFFYIFYLSSLLLLFWLISQGSKGKIALDDGEYYYYCSIPSDNCHYFF